MVGGVAGIGVEGKAGRFAPSVAMDEGEMPGGGTTNRGLTPALPISTEPNGIPDRETPLGEREGVEAREGAVLPEADPHVVVLPGSAVPVSAPP
jgi:hypothetical protein